MKKLIINLFCIAIGIFGTLGYQLYFPCCDQQATCTSDSTKVDSVKVVTEVSPTVIVSDTVKNDSVK